jgi:glycosyltransferase involved in cell wall biosynthesis
VNWPEPFGIAMIEAMACGTPVVAFRRGSVPEVMDNFRSGFIVGTVEEAVAAIKQVGLLSRRECRNTFERRFAVSRMAQDYLGIYERWLGRKSRVIAASHSDSVSQESGRWTMSSV